MKKMLFVLMALSLLSSPCLAIYTLTGNVYYQNTTTGVVGASVHLTGGGCTKTGTTGVNGSFTLQCGGDMSGSNLILTAHGPGGFSSGQRKWDVPADTDSQYKTIDVWPTIQSFSSLQMPSISTTLLGTPGTTVELVAPYQLQATGVPVQVHNAQINIAFNGAIQNVDRVESTTATLSFSYDVPVPGQLVVNVEFPPKKEVLPDFPAESFFDVFFDVDIPESGAVLGKVTIQEAIFNQGSGAELSGIPSLTEHLVGEYESPSPYFLVDSQDEWQTKLDADWPDVLIRPLGQEEGDAYLLQLRDFFVEGLEYSPIEPDLPEFIPSGLYVYGGDEADPDMPDDAGLVMKWGDDTTPDGEKASAWAWDYDDPDLSNCIITVTASPPGPSGINRISLGMQDVNGNIRSWWWNVPLVIAYAPPGTPTTITIDTSMTGIGATNPPASGFANNPLFNITQVQNIVADENANWVAQQGAPAPGGTIPAIWNYWHNLSVTPKTTAYKGNYVKFSQPPEVVEDDMIYGWDVKSVFPYNFDQGMTWTWAADDWRCYDERPVTDVHWWGSFIGWTQPQLPPQLPDYFMMAIWRDVPASADGTISSHPKELLWQHKCDKWVWNYAGYDLDPRFELNGDYNTQLFGDPQENESCFQFNQLLAEDDWFHQEPMEVLEDGTVVPNVYWFSIAAVYENTNISQIEYPWGWKSKPFDATKAPDPAVVITQLDSNTPPWDTLTGTTTGHITEVVSWFPLILPDPGMYPNGRWFDLAFELTTNEPKCPGLKADLNDDCIVNLPDFAIMAAEWLKTSP